MHKYKGKQKEHVSLLLSLGSVYVVVTTATTVLALIRTRQSIYLYSLSPRLARKQYRGLRYISGGLVSILISSATRSFNAIELT